MRFRNIRVENFRGIKSLFLENLKDTVVIAGPNGCGKSSLLEAIRLWKISYGAYHRNEMNAWKGELGLGNNNKNLDRVLQDATKPLLIEIELSLSDKEKIVLNENAERYLRKLEFRKAITTGEFDHLTIEEAQLDPITRPHAAKVFERANKIAEQLRRELSNETFQGRITSSTDATVYTQPSHVLSTIFGTYKPREIGKIEYHGPQRHYGRQDVGSINLTVEQTNQQRQQDAMSHKNYGTIKTEIAQAYVSELIKAEHYRSQGSDQELDRLENTMKEMFEQFFPEKEFLGVQSTENGTLSFNVKTPTGIHDLDELSSGEKELIYGYLRLKNEGPTDSIILFDEPELHLNPRLTQGLPAFYHKHIGQALDNQLFLVTHSDMILRESVGRAQYSVFHLQGAEKDSENQASLVLANTELEQAVIDLVGDLAAYKPNAATVFVEGGGVTRFDESMIKGLFPEVARTFNVVSVGDKKTVRSVHTLAESASSEISVAMKFFAITDKDDDFDLENVPGTLFSWDCYHIENYLLEELYIHKALCSLTMVGKPEPLSLDEVEVALVDCAKEVMTSLVAHEIENHCRKAMRGLARLPGQNGDQFSVETLFDSLINNLENVEYCLASELSLAELRLERDKVINKYAADLENGNWKKTFRGRDVIKRFVQKHARPTINYEPFRNLILHAMKSDGFRPQGMEHVLNELMSKQ